LYRTYITVRISIPTIV